MEQLEYQTADFAYDDGDIAAQNGARDSAGIPARVAIFADRPSLRQQIDQDLTGAGFRTFDGGPMVNLIDGQPDAPVTMLGDAVMVDCPVVTAASLAALARLDMRAARSGAKLIVVTSMEALDDVFAALDQSDPQILVQPSRADRVLAVGRVMADISNPRVREMTEEDRLGLLHLSRQVEAIAHKLEGLSGTPDGGLPGGAGHAALRAHANPADIAPVCARDTTAFGAASQFNSARPPLPDPHHVRRVIAARQARAKFFEGELFADPAWDMLLDLTAAQAENSRVSVTSLCIAAAVPATTALRWIKQLVDSDVFIRVADPNDKRRAFIALSEQSSEAMARYFHEVESSLPQAA